MSILIAIATTAVWGAIAVAVVWRHKEKNIALLTSALADEVRQHELTSKTLREVISRMRRERRERYLGIIEQQQQVK